MVIPGSQEVNENRTDESETKMPEKFCVMKPWAAEEVWQQSASEEVRALNCKERLEPKLSQS